MDAQGALSNFRTRHKHMLIHLHKCFHTLHDKILYLNIINSLNQEQIFESTV